MADYEVLDRRRAYDGFFKIDVYTLRHRLYRGGLSAPLRREVFERGHAAAVIPYDPASDRVVLIEQFRVGAIGAPGRPWVLEPVAGIIEEAESPEDVARREAREEAGLKLGELILIAHYLASPGGTSERITLYCGLVEANGAGGDFGAAREHEDIRAFALPFEEAWREVWARPVQAASTLIAMQWLALNRSRLRASAPGA